MEGKDGEDAAALRRRFRRVMATDLSLLPEGMALPPISMQPFSRYYLKNSEYLTVAGQRRVLDATVKIGNIDTFWFDAGWFKDVYPKGVGNYHFFHEPFPDGLKWLSDEVHAAGMKFMLWYEPERVYQGTEVYNEHPEFLLHTEHHNDPAWVNDFNHYLINLGDEAAWKYVYETLVESFETHGVDYYRQDYNIDPLAFWLEHDEPNRVGVTEIKHIDGLYRLWDALTERFPGLFIDNCSSGGRRLDFEMVRRGVPMWRSDIACWQITKERRRDVWDQNETLALSEYLPFNCAAIYEPKASEVRSSITSAFAVAFDVMNPDLDFEAAKRAVAEAKHLTHYWPGDFYPLTAPTLDEDGFAAYQVADGDRGFAMIFRREQCEADTFMVTLSAIDRTAEYAVTLTDEQYRKTETIVSGAALADGYAVILPDAHTSAVLEYKKI
jgi:alpha-galactosidase